MVVAAEKAVMQLARRPHVREMKIGSGRRAWTTLDRNCWVALLAVVAFCKTALAFAGPVKIACQGESVAIPGWTNGTMNVVYDDTGQGKLVIKGPHIEMSLPASLISMASANPPSNIISASGQTRAVMPDLATVDNCVASKVSPDENNDRDTYLNTALACMEAAPPSKGPVLIVASVKVGLMKGDAQQTDTWFEGEITYSDPSAGPGGRLTIPLLPGECKVVP